MSVLLATAMLLSACKRGALASWLHEHTRTSDWPLYAQDCPDGLARCQNGVVQVSRNASVPVACPSEPCACPWELIGHCSQGCADDQSTVVIDAPLALTQLCAPFSVATVLSAPPSVAPSVDCEEHQFVCVSNTVVSCSNRHAIASCPHGCAGSSLDDDMSARAASMILCAR